jgi:hypothetical protein
MLNVLCKRDQCAVEMYPAWPMWSLDLALSTLSTYPPPYLPGVMGTQFTGSLQARRMDLASGVEIRSQPNTDPVILDNVCDIIFIPSRKLVLECISNDCFPSTDCCYIFSLINHNKK